MKENKQNKYLTPTIKVVSFKVEDGFRSGDPVPAPDNPDVEDLEKVDGWAVRGF